MADTGRMSDTKLPWYRRLTRRVRAFLGPYYLTERLLLQGLEELRDLGNGRLVDFGCGDFRLSRPFHSKASEVYGVDNWLAAYPHRAAPEKATFLYGSIESAPFRESAFDLVLCTEVLEHVDDPDQVVREIRRVLKPGGKLLLSMPFNYFIHGAPNDYRRYTVFGLEKLLRAHDLEHSEHIVIGNGMASFFAKLAALTGQARGGKAKRLLGRATSVLCNLMGSIQIAVSKRPRRLTRLEARDHDHSDPLGYVFLATCKKAATVTESSEELATTPVACPNCSAPLEGADARRRSSETAPLRCEHCDREFRRFEGVPVLAEAEALHLEHETEGLVLELSADS